MTFTYTVTAADWWRILPELILVVITLLVMLVDLLLPQTDARGTGRRTKESGPANFTALPLLSFIGILGALVATITLFAFGDHQNAFNNMVGSDAGSLYAYLVILSASGLAILLSPAYLKRLNLVHQGEYYALLLLATIGMMLLAAAASFLVVFLGIEMLSLALYILCGFVARRRSSQEAGMKYFLLSSFASAFLLYGIALTYGATGNTSFVGIEHFLSRFTIVPLASAGIHSAVSPSHNAMLFIGMGLLAVGFAFKVSAIPFQAWTPDVYDGAPGPVTAFMSVGTKAAAIVAFARVFAIVLFPMRGEWLPVVEVIAILTIVGGNVLALVQTNLKRLLAYSSIAHAGYLLIGIVAATVGSGALSTLSPRAIALSAILFYLLCYTFMNMGAFGVASLLERIDNTGNDIQDLRGLWYRRPVLAGVLAFFLLALAGFPPMAGFAAKYYIFYAALQGGHPELLIIGVLASVLGMYYYLRLIAAMFMEQESPLAQVLGLGNIPVTPAPAPAFAGRVPPTPRIVPAPKPLSGRLASTSAATAVAVKSSATSVPKTPIVAEKTAEPEQTTDLDWISWAAIGIAMLGTLAMGTLLPFWLVNLAQQAATQMLIR